VKRQADGGKLVVKDMCAAADAKRGRFGPGMQNTLSRENIQKSRRASSEVSEVSQRNSFDNMITMGTTRTSVSSGAQAARKGQSSTWHGLKHFARTGASQRNEKE